MLHSNTSSRHFFHYFAISKSTITDRRPIFFSFFARRFEQRRHQQKYWTLWKSFRRGWRTRCLRQIRGTLFSGSRSTLIPFPDPTASFPSFARRTACNFVPPFSAEALNPGCVDEAPLRGGFQFVSISIVQFRRVNASKLFVQLDDFGPRKKLFHKDETIFWGIVRAEAYLDRTITVYYRT